MDKLVLVKWLDAEDEGSQWVDREDAVKFGAEVKEMESIGWIIHDTAKYLTLGADRSQDDQFGRVCKVPKGMVISVEDLK